MRDVSHLTLSYRQVIVDMWLSWPHSLLGFDFLYLKFVILALIFYPTGTELKHFLVRFGCRLVRDENFYGDIIASFLQLYLHMGCGQLRMRRFRTFPTLTFYIYHAFVSLT